MEIQGWGVTKEEMELQIDALYRPGSYSDGASLCRALLEQVDPLWQSARLYLVLNLAAQDLYEEALEEVVGLEPETLFEGLRLLTFGAGTDSEEQLYEDIVGYLEALGLHKELEQFFSTKILSPSVQQLQSSFEIQY